MEMQCIPLSHVTFMQYYNSFGGPWAGLEHPDAQYSPAYLTITLLVTTIDVPEHFQTGELPQSGRGWGKCRHYFRHARP